LANPTCVEKRTGKDKCGSKVRSRTKELSKGNRFYVIRPIVCKRRRVAGAIRKREFETLPCLGRQRETAETRFHRDQVLCENIEEEGLPLWAKNKRCIQCKLLKKKIWNEAGVILEHLIGCRGI